MKKTIYFHVGTVKTGSTLIQKNLWENRELLEKFNFHYFNIVEPKLSYPRFANAEFLFDKQINISDDDIKQYIKNTSADNLIISEEGLWGNMHMLLNKAFDECHKKIILYVRKPVDLIAAWASENAEPYNAFQKDASSGIGVVPIEKGIEEFTNRYITFFKSFFNNLKELQGAEIIIRPYDRSQFSDGDIFRDFLSILGIEATDMLENNDFHYSSVANVSKTRKFCDISTTVWEIMEQMNEEEKYCLEIVEYVYKNAKFGDDRPVLETLDKDTVIYTYEKLKFIDEEISKRYLNGKKLFQNPLPKSINDENKIEYQPVNKCEIKILINDFLKKKHNYEKRLGKETIMDSKRINALKDLSLEFEKSHDIDIAYTLMKIAYELRPHGPFIKEKYLQYKKGINMLKDKGYLIDNDCT